ncbi:MAG: tRNA lysidine(34) synthetase TilS [Gammaproteobacteria bacterium]|nr:tRNA lysidine(34) synthetase TilS [Gammaproteobacteria bacterium]
MSIPATQLESCLDCIPKDIDRVVLAYSGGLDSSVLLHLLASGSHKYQVLVWHVNHGLQVMAQEMETFCRTRANQYNLTIKTSQLNLDSKASNLESKARQARYALFEQWLTKNDCLLTAHHADDQAETFLLNALRGSGSAGLRGIAKSRPIGQSILLRPLLEVPGEALSSYASVHRLQWFDDPSNASDRFNRNYLRHHVMPLLKERWPGYLESIRSVVSIQVETQHALDELGAQDLQNLQRNPGKPDCLSIVDLGELSRSRQKNVIRYWLKHFDHASLPQSRLNQLIEQLKTRNDAMPMITGSGYDFRIYDRCLFLVPHGDPESLEESYDFNNQQLLKIETIGLQIERQSIMQRLKRKDSGQLIKLKFRRRAGTANPASHRLKRLFQKYKIPPWKRALTPQIFLDGELVDLWTRDLF